jgi:GT2 family glycosyltransferase
MGYNTKMLNRVRNTAIINAGTDLVLLTDNDITFDPDCLFTLVETLNRLPDAAVLTPRVMYQSERDRIYIDHNQFHFICSSIDKNRDKKVSELLYDSKEPKKSFGCGIMLLDKKKVEGIGFFDADFVMGWGDDGEFHHRINLSGMGCYAVPTALVFHKAIKGTPRVYGQHRNRWSMILQTYSWRTIFFISPTLVIYEALFFLYSLMDGKANHYIRSLRDIILNYRKLILKRRQISTYKVLLDREIMVSGEFFVPRTYKHNNFINAGLTILNAFFNTYWKLISRFL